MLSGFSSIFGQANQLTVKAYQSIRLVQAVNIRENPDAFKVEKQPLAAVGGIISKALTSSPATVKLGMNEALVKAQENPFTCALKIANTIEDKPSQDDDLLRTSKADVLGQVANWYAIAGQHDQVLESVNKIKDSEKKATALLFIATWYEDFKQTDKASQLLEEALAVTRTIKSPEKKAWILLGIVEQYKAARKTDKVYKLLKEALTVTRTIESARSKAYNLAMIANQYALAGQDKQAIEIAQTIELPNEKVRALTDIAAQSAKSGQKGKASELLFQAIEVVKTIKEDTRRIGGSSEALADIAAQYAAIGQYKQALALTRTIKDKFYASRALANIAKSYAAVRQYDQAFRLAQTISEPSYKSEALTALANSYAATGQQLQASKVLSQAFTIAETIKFDNSFQLTDIANSYVAIGEYDQALRVVRTIKDIETQVRALMTIAGRLTQEGKVEKASEMLSQSLLLARTIPSDYARSMYLTFIAGRYSLARQVEKAANVLSQALDAAQAMEEPSKYRSKQLAEIAQEYTAMGQYERALRVTQTIQHPSSKAVALASVAGSSAANRQELNKRSQWFLRQICSDSIFYKLPWTWLIALLLVWGINTWLFIKAPSHRQLLAIGILASIVHSVLFDLAAQSMKSTGAFSTPQIFFVVAIFMLIGAVLALVLMKIDHSIRWFVAQWRG